MSGLFNIKQSGKRNRLLFWVAAVGTGCVLLLFPLVRSFHVDSAVLAGTIGAFAGAWLAACPAARDRDALLAAGFVYISSIPLIARDALTGCLSADGAAFWLFIPMFSILFGFSAGRAIRRFGFPLPRVVSLVFVFAVAAGSVLVSMYFFPQLYFFNHVFGYWPGAIYDQVVPFPDRMILFRFITLGWIAVFWILPHLRGSDLLLKGIFALVLCSILLNYLMAPQHGLISPESRIQKELGGIHQTKHFTLYYSEEDYEPHELDLLGRLHEFHFRELTDTLKVEWPDGKRIHSYLYGNEWQMQRLTGAKGVSYVPVWNRRPQMHMRKTAIDGTLRHEMVHVIARQFGNRLLNASWSIGMVEGLAVALAPASSTRLTFDQMVVSNDAFYTLEEIEELFSLTGFYRRPGSAAYAVSGSFTATLLQEFPVELFKKAYRRSSLRRGYGYGLADAVKIWHARVAGMEVTEEEGALAEALFTAPSLFDERCPRAWTPVHRKRDAYRFALATGDTVRALTLLTEVLEAEPAWQGGWVAWLQLRLESETRGAGDLAAVAEEAAAAFARHTELSGHPLLQVRLADAFMTAGDRNRALEIRDRQKGSVNDLEIGAGHDANDRAGDDSNYDPDEYLEVGPDSDLSPGPPDDLKYGHDDDLEYTPADRASPVWRQAESAWQRRSDPDRWEILVRILYKPDLSPVQPPGFLVDTDDPLLVRVFFGEWFRRNPVPAAESLSPDHIATEIAIELIRRALEPPLDPHFFETCRSLIYLASPVLPAAFFEERLGGWMRPGTGEPEGLMLEGHDRHGDEPDLERLVPELRSPEGRQPELQRPAGQDGLTLRPIRQARLEEALRFAGS